MAGPPSLEDAFALEAQERYREAHQLYLDILVADPRNLAAADRLAAMYLADGDVETAIKWCETALAVDPAFPPARVNLGMALQGLGRLEDARQVFTALVADLPGFAAAHYLLGRTLWALERYEEAARSLERALQIAPEFAADYEKDQLDRIDQVDWKGYDASVALTVKLTWSGRLAMNPVKFMYCTGSAADHQQSGRVMARRFYPPRTPLWTRQARRPGKIRLGYLTSDFYDHAVAHIAVGYLENHDRDRFELTAFSCCPPYPSAIRDRVVAAFDRFENVVDLDDAAIARLIRERDIDVLVSLSGYAYRARPGVLAWRPAPVQVNFSGYPGTLGAAYVDYIIADKVVIPEDQARFYDEKIAWMPGCYQVTDDKAPRTGPMPTRQACGLPDDALVLMAYHPPSKISPAIFEVWMNILRQTPDAVLWLQEAVPEAQANLRREAAARGVDPARMVFSTRLTSRAEHMARHALADLFIDSLPYNAHSTATDALWAGLPVVTCAGASFPGRVCASAVTTAGLSELATTSLSDYEALVLALAADRPRLAALRARVERDAPGSALFQSAAYTRHLEAAYQTMYERAQSGLAPASFSVTP